MAKEKKTREELAAVVLREARASGKCPDLHSIFIAGPTAAGYSNWDIGTASNTEENSLSPACRIELNMIVGRLQAQYDLLGD